MSLTPTVPGTSLYAAIKGSATFVPFRQRIFTAMWVASLVSNFGSLVQSVGASWLMTSIAPSPDMVALVQAAMTLPILMFSLAAGAVADIFDRRLVMVVGQVFMLLVSIALAAQGYFGSLGPWALLGYTFLLGAGAALYGPAWQASVRDLVPREQIPAAVALNTLNYNVARSLGPALGGVIVAALGPSAAFLFNAFSYAGLIAVLGLWRPPRAEQRLPPESMGPAMIMGLRYAGLSPQISAVLLRSASFGFCGSAIWALLPVVARHLVGGGPLTYGILLGALGIGAIVGAFVSGPLRHRYSAERITRVGLLIFALALLIAANSHLMVALVPSLIVLGTSWVLSLATYNMTVQLSSPQWVLGRTMAVYQMTVFGGLALGSWIWGKLADQTSLSLSLSVAAFAMAATFALTLRFRLPASATGDLEPLGVLAEPKVTLDFDSRNGPIVTSIAYRIESRNAPEFVAAMSALRHVRRRDGARNWMLLQDIAEPELWTERYESSTWLEHMRQHQRVTNADQAIIERVLALHKGPEPPQVRNLLEWPMVALGARVAADDAKES